MKVVALDTETTGLTWTDTPFAVSLWEPDVVPWDAYYYDWREDETEKDKAIKALQFYFDTDWEFVFHNAKYDMRMLGYLGFDFSDRVVHDTHALAHLLDEHQDKKLKALARKHLGVWTDEEEALKVVRRKLKVVKADGYLPIPRDILEPYAIKDAEFTYLLFRKFYPVVKANPELHELYLNEMQLTKDLMEIESYGMAIDVEYVDTMLNSLAIDLMNLTDETTDMMRGTKGISDDPNPASTPQLLIYFQSNGIDLPNVQRATLEEVDHPLAKKIVELRQKGKLRDTYFKNIRLEQVDGILHPNFRQHGTVTGRMSSGTATA